jgi:crossover junction endodeoxyribonuclease RuvC
MIILGIDPGLAGALAVFNADDGGLVVHDAPTLRIKPGSNRRELDLAALASMIDQDASHITHAFLERAGAMPGQGVSSMFSLGQTYGMIRGLLAANFIPLTIVGARTWKAALSVPAAKDGARARASQLLPRHAGLWTRKKDHGRAESALIALYGARLLKGS